MKTGKSLMMILAMSFALLGLFSLAWAAEKVQLPLKAEKNEPGASGKVTLGDDTLSVQAKGLHPNAVYTVWFVNMKPKKEAGVGEPPYMFKTDAQGNGSYSATFTESPAGKWEMVMIVLHPNDDPKDMKNIVSALTTKLPKARA